MRTAAPGRRLIAVRLSPASVSDSEMRALVAGRYDRGGSTARPAPRRVLGLVGLGLVLLCWLVLTRSWSGVTPLAAAVAPHAALGAGEGQGLAALSPAARLSISGEVGAQDAQFHIVATPGGGLLARSATDISARFGADGASVSAGATTMLRLRLEAIGRGESSRAVSRVAPGWRGNRVSYGLSGVREWYTNGPFGLEQGFTLASRPAGSGPLTLAVGTLARDVGARLALGGQSLMLTNGAGRVLARYGELSVVDAAGRRLGARIALNGHRVVLAIDDAGARYPLRIDPLVQSAALTATGSARDLGASVAVSANGQVLAVGAPGHANVDVFTRPSSGSWKSAHQTVSLQVHDVPSLGDSVAISANGKTIVAGAPGQGDGAAYVFTEPSNGWKHSSGKPKAQLVADAPTGQDALGTSVAINAAGNAIVAGAPGWNNQEGAVYLFTKSSHGWQNSSHGVYANVGEPNDDPCDICGVLGGEFGTTVAMSGGGGTIVVGAPLQSNGEGAVYVLERGGGYKQLPDMSSGTSDQDGYCNLSSGYGNPNLGQSVAISADAKTIVAGQPCWGTGGQAVVYTRPSGGWLHASGQATGALIPLSPHERYTRQLGSAVAISGDGNTIVADDPDYLLTGGFVATFDKPARGWNHVNPPDPKNFGVVTTPTGLERNAGSDPIAISSGGSTVFVGAVGPNGHGIVYVYTPQVSPTTVVCSPSTVKIGKTSTCTATVKDAKGDTGTPTGTVRFSSTGGSAAHFNHTKCTLSGSGARARCKVTLTPHNPRAYVITAHYGGDSHHPSGKGTTIVNTPKNTTTTVVSCTPSTVAPGGLSACTATVTGTGPNPPPVNIQADTGTRFGASCSPGHGSEICHVGLNTAGIVPNWTIMIEAIYPSDATDASSTGHTTVQVRPPTSTSLLCQSPINTTQTARCRATVTNITGPEAPPPVGFSLSPGGATYTLVSCAVSGSGNDTEICKINVNSSTAQTYTVRATFPSDDDAAGSSATSPLTVVNYDTTTTAVACTRATLVSCTATVTDTGPTPSVPTGSVLWGSTQQTSIPACTLASAGGDTASCTTSFDPSIKTAFTVTANYQGDVAHQPSSGQANVT